MMQTAQRGRAAIEIPPALVFTTAVTCGVLAALALQLYLSSIGYHVVNVLEATLSAKALGPWWALAGLSCVASGATAAALSRLPLPWRRFRLLRWIAGAALVFGLAHLGHVAAAPEGVAPGSLLAASLGALVVATLMAMLGASLTVRR